MANYRAFHTQLAAIMETLTRAAVAEICELVDDGYAILHTQISRHQKEKEELIRKLQMIESIVAVRAYSEDSAAAAVVVCDAEANRSACGSRESLKRLLPAASRDPERTLVTVQVKEEGQQQPQGDDCETEAPVAVTAATSASAASCSTDEDEIHFLSHSRHPLLHSSNDDLHTLVLADTDSPNPSAHTVTETHSHTEESQQSSVDLTTPEEPKQSDPHAVPDTNADCALDGVQFSDKGRVKRKTVVLGSDMNQVLDWSTQSMYCHGTTNSAQALAAPTSPLYSAQQLVALGNVSGLGMFGGPGSSKCSGTGKRQFICSICGKNFTTAQSLDTHTRIHTGERPYGCEHCGKRFTQSGHLTAHQNVHTGERPYECTHCGKRFAGKQYLRIHVKKHHIQ